MTSESDSRVFQVDLRGLVDLLSHHLYSSPRVYVRELLQNAVDATTARLAVQPDARPGIHITVGDGWLRIEDAGIGLSVDEVHDLLATIGRSSKRDDFESARREFLGQFGIGLLACFVVAAEIRVVSRSAVVPGAAPVEWRARDDGSYTVTTLPGDARAEPGTTVHLTARPEMAEWLAPQKVRRLAAEFGSLLPFDVTVSEGGEAQSISERPAVWDREYGSGMERRLAINSYCERVFGFAPLDVIELDLPVAGVRGLGFVLPRAASPAQKASHRVYLKGMLLSESADALLPDWAFFLRAVVDTDSLRPTASRENLYDDETLAGVREALGGKIRDWLARLAAGDPQRLRQFLAVHHLGVKALALHDATLLEIMLPWLPFETTDGQTNLDAFARKHSTVYVTETTGEFHQIAPIAAAQGIGVVNGGYTYDADLVAALPRIRPGSTVSHLDSDVVTASLEPVEPARELALAGFLAAARGAMDPHGCDVVLRTFQPVGVPALFLDDRAAQHERRRADTEAGADDLWSGILSSLRDEAPRARLVLNDLNPLVRRVAALSDAELAGTAVASLYGQALLASQRPLRPSDTALLNKSFLDLLDRVTTEETDR